MVGVGRSSGFGARFGLKRELAFALRSQAEVSGLPGRTRSGKTRSGGIDGRDSALENLGNKKRKRMAEESRMVGSPAAPTGPEAVVEKVIENHDMEEMGIVINGRDGAMVGGEKGDMVEAKLAEDNGEVINGGDSPKDIVIHDGDALAVNAKESLTESIVDRTLKDLLMNDVDVDKMLNEDPLKETVTSSGKPLSKEGAPLLKESENQGPMKSSENARLSSGDSDITVDEQIDVSKVEIEADEMGMSDMMSPTKKLEMKMSKKISLMKSPCNMKDLSPTGPLEDTPVKCSLGIDELVSSSYFEQHASRNYIDLDKGKSTHVVSNSCNNALHDKLEEANSTAIGSAPGDKIVDTCKNHEGNLSSACLEAEQYHVTPSKQANGSVRSSGVNMVSSASTQKTVSSHKNGQSKITKKDLRLHKLVFMDDILPDGTEVGYYVRGQKLLEGYIQGTGIFCRCCNNVVSPSQFEAHAGCASRRKPYLQIYTSNGVSLHELSISLMKAREKSTKESDNLCGICSDGGDLVLCDICPRAFHAFCVGLQSVPTGDWYCPYCQNMFQRELVCARNANAMAAGRVLGVDSIEQISNRCIRIVKASEIDISCCVLCKGHDFTKTGFGDRTVMLCDQCEKEYHVGCLRDHKMGDLKELPTGNWFCCSDCSRIHVCLEKLLHHGSEQLPESISCVIKIKNEERNLGGSAKPETRWRLLSGRLNSPDSRSLLSKALAIFHECFDPIVDGVTGRDLIPSMVYGSKIGDQEFEGMYCAVLMIGSFVASAGILRVMGSDVAELPLVATTKEYQGQGYFQALFACIERLLGFLNVKHLVLPAAGEAESIWTNKFGFTKITQDQLNECANGARPMTFQGTSMLHKLVPKCRIVHINK
ncbi:Histone-lysine N-methyltransferase ATXR5 [Acorus calamus]|uniref:Histone-lysine N-methyltransferase ATXR5 n=1 Tax=Acorus calamus TaxID=4465 RepID=A0AAV9CPS1_ACOCL|nr:Histone-lysine N-methyltransferase ATXR5 [Acorus calamus]